MGRRQARALGTEKLLGRVLARPVCTGRTVRRGSRRPRSACNRPGVAEKLLSDPFPFPSDHMAPFLAHKSDGEPRVEIPASPTTPALTAPELGSPRRH